MTMDWAAVGTALTGTGALVTGLYTVLTKRQRECEREREADRKEFNERLSVQAQAIKGLLIEKDGSPFAQWSVEDGRITHINDAMILFLARVNKGEEDVINKPYQEVWESSAVVELKRLDAKARALPNTIFMSQSLQLLPGLPETTVGKIMTLRAGHDGRAVVRMFGVLIPAE